MTAAEGDEVQIVSAMPAFQTRRHTSSAEVVVARRSDHRHTSPVTDLALQGLETRRDPGHPCKRKETSHHLCSAKYPIFQRSESGQLLHY